MSDYVKFELSPGQSAPVPGATGVALSSGWIVWIGDENDFPEAITHALMTQDEIDEYNTILATPDAEAAMREKVDELFTQLHPRAEGAVALSKYQFRTMFTLNERIAFDNFAANDLLPAEAKMAINTIKCDFDAAQEIDIHLQDTVNGLLYLEGVGILSVGRTEEMLAAHGVYLDSSGTEVI